MEHIAIEAQPRAAHVSKGVRKQLRRAGHIPAAVFGRGVGTTLVTVEAKDIARVLASNAGQNTLIDLSVGGARHLAKLTEVEIDPISRVLNHVGLHTIQASESQKATVPIELVGEPEAIHMGTGVLESGTLTLDVKALPEKLAPSITVDVSRLNIGDVLYASDVTMPDGHELLTSPDIAIASLHVARQIVSETELDREEDEISPTRDSVSIEESLVGV